MSGIEPEFLVPYCVSLALYVMTRAFSFKPETSLFSFVSRFQLSSILAPHMSQFGSSSINFSLKFALPASKQEGKFLASFFYGGKGLNKCLFSENRSCCVCEIVLWVCITVRTILIRICRGIIDLCFLKRQFKVGILCNNSN